MMRIFFVNAKKSKKVNTIIQQNFRKNVIDNFIKNKDIKTIKKSDFSWTIPKEKRILKNSWNQK
tara:strand:- start:515 stop:706 length:192 start_codon:yes stop_codon:yes gene_type:complete